MGGGAGNSPLYNFFFTDSVETYLICFPPSLNCILHFITVVWIVLILDILPHILLLRSPVPLLDGYRVPVPLLDGYRVPVPLLDGYRVPVPLLDGYRVPVLLLDGYSVGSFTGWL